MIETCTTTELDKIVIIDSGSSYSHMSVHKSEQDFEEIIEGHKVIQNVVLRPGYICPVLPAHASDAFIGKEIFSVFDERYAAVQKIHYPIKNGKLETFSNWNNMYKLWSHFFYNVLKLEDIEGTTYSFILTYNPEMLEVLIGRNYTTQVAKIIYEMFEGFYCTKLLVLNRTALCLYCTGKKTGCVLHVGGDSTNVTIFVDGIIKHFRKQNSTSGNALTRIILEKISKKVPFVKIENNDFYPLKKSELRIWNFAEEIKHNHFYIKNDDKVEQEDKSNYRTFKIPDQERRGSASLQSDSELIISSEEMYQIPETLFFSNNMKEGTLSLQDIVMESLLEIKDPENRRKVSKNIICEGGTTLMEGFERRFTRALRERFDEERKRNNIVMEDYGDNGRIEIEIKVVFPENRFKDKMPWLGASLYADEMARKIGEKDDEKFVEKDTWLTLEEYDDLGPEETAKLSGGRESRLFEEFHPFIKSSVRFRSCVLKDGDVDEKERIELLNILVGSRKISISIHKINVLEISVVFCV